MTSQKDLIDEMKWDYLIVLDACRYDYFREIYADYLHGRLRKAISAASGTPEWLEETFEG